MSAFKVVREFEAALCEYTGAPYCVTTTSCTMALLLAVAWQLHSSRKGFPVEIPKRTYVGVPYSILNAGGKVRFRDEEWWGMYQLKPLPIWDSARWIRRQLYAEAFLRGGGQAQPFVCVSFHWNKTLGIQQGGAILHSDPEADAWFRRARFDGRTEGVPAAEDKIEHRGIAMHAYMAPETAAAGLVRLASLPAVNEPLPNDPYPDLSQIEAFR